MELSGIGINKMELNPCLQTPEFESWRGPI